MEACCKMLFHSIGALAKNATVGFCFHLAGPLLPVILSSQVLQNIGRESPQLQRSHREVGASC